MTATRTNGNLLVVNDDELDLILSALAVTAPSGGGSSIFTLYRKLAAATGRDANESTQMMLCNNMLDDAIEAGVCVRVN